jgi:hypothetical protein
MKLIQTIETTASLEMTREELNANPVTLEMSREELYIIRRMLSNGYDDLQNRTARLQSLADKLKGLDEEQAYELIAETDWCEPEDVTEPEDVAYELEAHQKLLEQVKGIKGELERITEEGDLAPLL